MVSNLHVRLKDEYKRDQVDQLLSDKFTFVVASPISDSWVFYDTFDWRLFNRSILLRRRGETLILDHLNHSESMKGLVGNTSLDFASNLPEGQLRELLVSVTNMRALLPLVEIHTWSKIYRILNKVEKTVARVLYTEVRTFDEERELILATYFSIQPVRGYPKISRKLARYLHSIGQESALTKDIYLSALKRAGLKPGSYTGKLALWLKSKKRADESTKVILRQLFEIMKANEPGIKADIDTEFLHDYRIAVRRTRSALGQIRDVFPAETTEHFKQSFKYVGRLTNDLRDLDVYLLSENDFETRLPETMRQDIVPLFEYLRFLRGQALEVVIEGLSSGEYTRVLNEWEKFLDESIAKKTAAANGAMPIIELARKRIYKRYRRVIKDGDYILTNTQDELLHALRIECKKLRYLMEFFTSLFPFKKMTKLIKQLKKLQDNLGEFNDLSVQQEYLMRMAEELPIDDPRSRKALVATGYLVENLGYKQKAVKENFADIFTEFASKSNQKSFRRLFATKGKKASR